MSNHAEQHYKKVKMLRHLKEMSRQSRVRKVRLTQELRSQEHLDISFFDMEEDEDF